jgi:hypothetical protein
MSGMKERKRLLTLKEIWDSTFPDLTELSIRLEIPEPELWEIVMKLVQEDRVKMKASRHSSRIWLTTVDRRPWWEALADILEK